MAGQRWRSWPPRRNSVLTLWRQDCRPSAGFGPTGRFKLFVRVTEALSCWGLLSPFAEASEFRWRASGGLGEGLKWPSEDTVSGMVFRPFSGSMRGRWLLQMGGGRWFGSACGQAGAHRASSQVWSAACPVPALHPPWALSLVPPRHQNKCRPLVTAFSSRQQAGQAGGWLSRGQKHRAARPHDRVESVCKWCACECRRLSGKAVTRCPPLQLS